MTLRIAVTGGLGFIGSEFIRRAVTRGDEVLNIDAHTYAADPARVASVATSVKSLPMDVNDPRVVDALSAWSPEVVVHFAAETHVTRSEIDPELFVRSNVDGTRHLLSAAERSGADTFVHISTDEVYGPCLGAAHKEEDKGPGEGSATSAYARSKALADDEVLAYRGSMRALLVRPTNCFGSWQYPEKAIPRWIARALSGQTLPVWGDGRQVRQWMHVSDACRAIETVIEKGQSGSAYNAGPAGEAPTNLEVAQLIATMAGIAPDAVYLTAYDRPAHDRRYAVDPARLHALGWSADISLEQGLRETVEWYRDHRGWWQRLIDEAESIYDDEEAAGER